MQKALRLSSVLGLMLVALLVPVTIAQSDALQQASELFDKQEYVAAQSALLKIDPAELSDEEAEQLDIMLAQVDEAIAGSEKAAQAKADADTAYDNGQWDEAETLYKQVLGSDHANTELTTAAQSRLDQIAAKRALDEAAQPSGPVSETPMEEAEEMTPVEETPVETMETAETTTSIYTEPMEVEVVEDVEVVETTTATTEVQAAPQSTRRTSIDEMRQQDALLWQRAMAQVKQHTANARQAILANRYVDAKNSANAAKETVEANKQYAVPTAKYESALHQAIALINEVNAAAEGYRAQQADIAVKGSIERIEDAIRLESQQRQAKVDQLFEEVATLRKQGRNAEAVERLKTIIELDPSNENARGQYMYAKDLAAAQTQRQTSEHIADRTAHTMSEAVKAMTPGEELIVFPPEFEDKIRESGKAGLSDAARRDEIDAILDTSIPHFQLEETTLGDWLRYIRETYNFPVDGDWPALEDVGIDAEYFILEFDMRNTTLRAVMNELIRRLISETDERVGLDILPDMALIVPYEKMTVYAVSYDLLHMMYLERPDIDLDAGGGAGGGDLDTGGDFGDTDDTDREGYVDQLTYMTDILRGIVGEDNWPDNATMTPMPRYNLIISQTYENHKKIREFLLLAVTDNVGPGGGGKLCVAFEVRFLRVTHNFLEEIGVDLDFVFNSGTAGYDSAVSAGGTPLRDPYTGANVLMPRQFAQAGAYASPVAFGQPFSPGASPSQPYNHAAFVPNGGGIMPTGSKFTPIPVQSGSLDIADPRAMTTGIAGSFTELAGPAISIAGSFLDNLQVDFLVRATQANRRSSVVTAPRLVVANGEEGYLTFGDQTTYVSELTGVADSMYPDINTEELTTGTSLAFTRVVITPNHRYVTTDINLVQNGAPSLQTFGATSFSQVTTPAFETRRIRTRASIPDGGTLLIGGLKNVGEIEVDAGDPILSKIPILKRAFTNTSKVKDTQTQLILIKTDIIIPNELEKKAFPHLYGSDGQGI